MPSGPSQSADLRITEPLCAVFRRKLKLEGLKYTPERAYILDAVISMPGTFDAESLLAALRPGGRASGGNGPRFPGGVMRISKATAYRTIKLLLEAGILQQVLVDSEHAHYQLAYGRGPVATLVRGDNEQTEQIELPELDALAAAVCRQRGLKLRGHRFVIYADGAGGAGS
jgi:Fe2+ or Zn2+ uptake regulation protein